jgi:Uma2 family endonuclease
MNDYEAYGVGEYWIIVPEQKSMTFYRLESGKFVESKTTGDRYESRVLAGFALDLLAIRTLFDMSHDKGP